MRQRTGMRVAKGSSSLFLRSKIRQSPGKFLRCFLILVVEGIDAVVCRYDDDVLDAGVDKRLITAKRAVLPGAVVDRAARSAACRGAGIKV